MAPVALEDTDKTMTFNVMLARNGRVQCVIPGGPKQVKAMEKRWVSANQVGGLVKRSWLGCGGAVWGGMQKTKTTDQWRVVTAPSVSAVSPSLVCVAQAYATDSPSFGRSRSSRWN